MSDNAPARPLLELVEATLNQQGKTKTWLAGRSKVSRAAINNWRHQPRTPQAANVLAVADALGIEQETALRLAGLAVESPPPPDLGGLAGLANAELIEMIRRLADELARRIPF